MPTSSPRKLHCLALLAFLLTTLSPAQTLAHRNWAGSGLTASHWWRNAIFYRVDPIHFQDSDNDGTGDLRGLALRLDYLQSLGVDALILSSPGPSDPGFDDLLSAASQRHLRLIIALRSTPGVNLLAAARSWLTRGAAGIELLATDPNTDATADSLAALHTLTRTFPGERIVLAAFDRPLSAPPPKGADLLETPIALSPPQIPQPAPSALLLTDQHTRSAETYAQDPAAALSLDETAALLLLSTPGPISLLYGQELGLQQPLDATMQWTPTNLTPANFTEPKPATTEPPPAPKPVHRADPNVYGAYVPYVAPKTSKPTPTVFDPNNLRGFSTNPTTTTQAATSRNAAEEDRDPKSLLNFYRRLIQLHHDNLVLRNGAVVLLHHDNILAWLRVLPSAARTNPPILIVCNPTDQPIHFDPSSDMAPYHARHLAFRTLLTSAPLFTIETTDNFTLPPHTVYMGELYR